MIPLNMKNGSLLGFLQLFATPLLDFLFAPT